MVLSVGEAEIATEAADSLVKAATEDIGYDDISDDELDDLIDAAEDEHDDKPTDSIGRLLMLHLLFYLLYNKL